MSSDGEKEYPPGIIRLPNVPRRDNKAEPVEYVEVEEVEPETYGRRQATVGRPGTGNRTGQRSTEEPVRSARPGSTTPLRDNGPKQREVESVREGWRLPWPLWLLWQPFRFLLWLIGLAIRHPRAALLIALGAGLLAGGSFVYAKLGSWNTDRTLSSHLGDSRGFWASAYLGHFESAGKPTRLGIINANGSGNLYFIEIVPDQKHAMPPVLVGSYPGPNAAQAYGTILVQDLNGDGKPDVILYLHSSDTGLVTYMVLINTGTDFRAPNPGEIPTNLPPEPSVGSALPADPISIPAIVAI